MVWRYIKLTCVKGLLSANFCNDNFVDTDLYYVSGVQVKMMSVLHGEQYPACLVSPDQSSRQLIQLKADMQKAFAYSEGMAG